MKGSNDKYFRKHLALTPAVYKIYIKGKAKAISQTELNLTDNEVIKYVFEKFLEN